MLIEVEFPIAEPIFKPVDMYGRPGEIASFQLSWSRYRVGANILVEAKSILPTLGELMRQIQLYRTVFKGVIVVVAPYDKYAKKLAEQGVTFVRYAPLVDGQSVPVLRYGD